MLDDAPEKGRQTNRKFITILLLLAMAACAGAWSLNNWGVVSSRFQNIKNRFLQKAPQWQAAACTKDTKGVLLDGGICLLTEGRVLGLDTQGQVQYTLDTEAEVLSGGTLAAAYTPLGKTIYLLGTEKAETLTISGGADRVISGAESHVAVITAGSGYLTKTVIYSGSGQLLGEIGLTDAVMAAAAFVAEDELLAGLCVGRDGSWELRYYGMDGGIQYTIALDDLLYRDIMSCGSGILLETEEEILFLNEAGTQTGSFAWNEASLDALECSQDGYAVLGLSQGRSYVLCAVGVDGSLWGEVPLDEPIRGLSVCGNTVCILDFESLRVYDRHCEPTKIFPEGARAVSVIAQQGACWLLGDGELLHLGFT